jgi:hypothetical protein
MDLSALPVELVGSVASFLSEVDAKSLALTSRGMYAAVCKEHRPVAKPKDRLYYEGRDGSARRFRVFCVLPPNAHGALHGAAEDVVVPLIYLRSVAWPDRVVRHGGGVKMEAVHVDDDDVDETCHMPLPRNPWRCRKIALGSNYAPCRCVMRCAGAQFPQNRRRKRSPSSIS